MLKNKHLTRALQACSDMGAWLLIIVVAIILTICTDTFFTWDNIMNVVRQTCVVSIIALGSSFVVLGGEIDLSTGMVSTLAGCTTALLITKAGFTTFPAILVAILIGAIIGTFTGCIVTFLKIPAFIGSLGVQYIVQGTILITTNSMPITGLPDDFLFLGRGYIANVLPFPIIIMLVFFIIGAVVFCFFYILSCGARIVNVIPRSGLDRSADLR